jgi:DNA polymerase
VEKPQNLYADALASGGCLIVTEAFWSPQTPPSEWLLGPSRSAAGHLLDNLLRAVQWHQSAQVSVLGLRPATGAPVEADAESLGTDLAEVIARLAPKVVLLMGRVAAQQVLQTTEPLGRLRGQVHSCHGSSAVVTLDAPSLLRHPADKARVWTDLGLALPLMSA